MTRHYAEQIVRFDGDPLWTAARLAAAAGDGEPHVVYERAGQWSVALGAHAEIVLDRHSVRLRCGGTERAAGWRHDPMPVLAGMLAELPVAGWRCYGWAGFELAYASQTGGPELPDGALLHLVVPRREVRLAAGTALLRALDPADLAALTALVQHPAAEPARRPAQPLDVTGTGGHDYRATVARAVDEIVRRELQKVILSRVVPVEHPLDLAATYLAGRRANTPARSFLLDLGGVQAAGFSPETVVEVAPDGRVSTQPLAGTRARTGDPATDAVLRAELLGDAKETFEHAISVKVAYDEMTRLCLPGSVAVADFMTVKERGSVQHLASRVAGALPAGQDCWRAFGALFPAVTASGVPKPAAYASIRRHEPQPRGLYSGAVLTADAGGELDAALVLRSVFQQDGRAWLRAGAGIVEQSDPAREFEETCEKLASVARFLVPAATEPTGTARPADLPAQRAAGRPRRNGTSAGTARR